MTKPVVPQLGSAQRPEPLRGVTLEDGTNMRGKFIVPASRTLFEVLNNAGAFIEFEPYGCERSIVAKSSIRTVRIVNAPAASSLAGRGREIDTFDPHIILGVSRTAPFEEIRQAYLRLTKAYHPDRYSGVELPAEVSAYLAAMAQRVNLAYAALEAPVQVKKAVAQRVAPIYTSAPRA